MGLFGKKKKAAEEEAAHATWQAQETGAAAGYQGPPAQAPGQGQPGPAGPAQWQPGPPDTATPGTPPGAPLAADDPLWEPIYGLSVDHYAQIVKYAVRQGLQDEYSICQFAQQHYGIAAETWNAAAAGWVDRMGRSAAIDQRFRQVYDAS
ncbi:MAG: hypothetical protein U0U69_06920 [Acidimicrobiia bacterium]